MTTDLATLLGQNFIQRKDVKAVQTGNGAYVPACTMQGQKHDCGTDCTYEKWSMQDLNDHVEGKKTFGHYMLGTDNMVKLFAFDLDLKEEGLWQYLGEDIMVNGGQPCNPQKIFNDYQHPGWEWFCIRLRCLAEGIAIKTAHTFDKEFNVQIAYSGNKGLHVYCFTGPRPAAEAREMARLVLKSFHCFEPSKGENFYMHKFGSYAEIEIEIFPKQDELSGGQFGNLMRLPLGVNKKSGNKGFFINPEVGYNQLVPLDPVTALTMKGADTFYTR